MRIFINEFIHPEAMKILTDAVEIVSEDRQRNTVDGILTRNLVVDRAWMESCPSLKVIGIHGTGTDAVDLQAAKELGIQVIYTPHMNARSVAELICADALILSRKIHLIDRTLANGGVLENGCSSLQGTELYGKTFGMVGCGTIAKIAAEQLRAGFGMNIIGWSRSLTPEKAAQLRIGYCETIEDVFAQADVICIGLALTPETKGVIDAGLLHKAKRTAILINTARGALIDEQALYCALTEGRLAAAAGDVFISEPPSMQNNPLVGLTNYLATPHIGANTDEALERVGVCCAEQILKVLRGETDGLLSPL